MPTDHQEQPKVNQAASIVNHIFLGTEYEGKDWEGVRKLLIECFSELLAQKDKEKDAAILAERSRRDADWERVAKNMIKYNHTAGWRAANKTGSDAGAGFTIGYKAALEELLEALNPPKVKGSNE